MLCAHSHYAKSFVYVSKQVKFDQNNTTQAQPNENGNLLSYLLAGEWDRKSGLFRTIGIGMAVCYVDKICIEPC